MRGRAAKCAPALLLALAFALSARGQEPPGPRGITLAEAVDTALRLSPALRGAERDAEAARAAAERAGSETAVQLRADSRYTHLSDVPSMSIAPGRPPKELGRQDTWLADLAAQKTLYSGGRLEALTRQASASAAAAQATRERVRQVVAFGAERSFRVLLAAQRSREAAVQSLAAAEEHLAAARDRFEAGTAARFDVLRAEVETAEARQRLAAAASDIGAASAAFLEALGLESGEYSAAEEAPVDTPRRPLEEMLQAARRNRPELAALALGVEAAREGIQAARGERLPVVSVSADYQWAQPESLNAFDRWSVGVALTLPLIDGGRAAAGLRRADALRGRAEADLDGMLRRVEAEVRAAHARLAAADSGVELAVRRLEQAEELRRVAEARYGGGVGTAVEVADAQARLTAARFELVRSRVDQEIAEAELRLAAGTILTPAEAPGEEAR